MKQTIVILVAGLIILNSCVKEEIIYNDPTKEVSYKDIGCGDISNIKSGLYFPNLYSESDYLKYKYVVKQGDDANKLQGYLEEAKSGDVIYINSDVEIILNINIEIKPGVELVSNRGEIVNSVISKGAKLINGISKEANTGEFNLHCITAGLGSVDDTQIKISGIRFDASNNGEIISTSQCIRGQNLFIENCEFSNWAGQAIEVQGDNNYIYSNYIHDCYVIDEDSYGYGIKVTDYSFAKIEKNIFRDNRHSITGVGGSRCSYEACYNLIEAPKRKMQGAAFDMHPWGFNEDSSVAGYIAGQIISIYNNIFQPASGYGYIYIRGIPIEGCFIFNNAFYQSKEMSINNANRIGRIYSFNNCYSSSFPKWYISSGLVCGWSPLSFGHVNLSNVRVFDFDGDGIDEIFRIQENVGGELYNIGTHTEWLITNLKHDLPNISKPISDWHYINSLNVNLGDLRIAKFNDDNADDVFFVSETNAWQVSFSGKSNWFPLGPNSSNPIEQYQFADFNGNNITDIFISEYNMATGLYEWKVSYDGRSGWTKIADTHFKPDEIRIGKFDNDNRSDIFVIDGNLWKISSGGITGWNILNEEMGDFSVDQLRFIDYDRNGITDVFRINEGKMQICYGGKGEWINKGSSDVPIDKMIFGYFDEDSIIDVITSFDEYYD